MPRATNTSRFRWTAQKEPCADLYLAGVSNRQIAAEIGVNRNSVNAWVKHPEFCAEVRRRLKDHISALRLRRLPETNVLNDRIVKLARDALTAVAEDPGDREKLRTLRQHLHDFRQMRDQERKDFGDDVERMELRGALRDQRSNYEFRDWLLSLSADSDAGANE